MAIRPTSKPSCCRYGVWERMATPLRRSLLARRRRLGAPTRITRMAATTLNAARTRRLERTSRKTAMRSAPTPPTTPPRVDPVAIRATCFLAACGSKRSLMTDQNPLVTIEPKAAMCR